MITLACWLTTVMLLFVSGYAIYATLKLVHHGAIPI